MEHPWGRRCLPREQGLARRTGGRSRRQTDASVKRSRLRIEPMEGQGPDRGGRAAEHGGQKARKDGVAAAAAESNEDFLKSRKSEPLRN